MKLLNRSEKGVEMSEKQSFSEHSQKSKIFDETKFFQKKIILVLFLFILGCVETGNIIQSDGSSGSLENGIRVINVNAFQYDFDPNPIIVNNGERVKLVMTSTDVAHGFTIPEFNINTPLPPGKQITIEFTADKQGTFPFFCNLYCGSGHSGMRGNLIVR